MSRVDSDKVPVERRLAAILFADVVGYSRLMGANEEATHARLKSLRRELIDPKITEHRGRIVRTTGDGMLIEFPSVVEAVRCAVEVQQGMADRNRDVPPDQRMDFRVGINLGDVIAEEGDIYGDGVNVAARLEALAEPGGICISGTVRNHIGDRLALTLIDLGERSVKNIARPVRVYRIDVGSKTGASAAIRMPRFDASITRRSWQWAALAFAVVAMIGAGVGVSLWRKPGSVPRPERPSIAVLPFANQSGDAADNYFSEGITGDIINALGRFPTLTVKAASLVAPLQDKVTPLEVGRSLGVRYLVEGSVRRAADRVRVSTRLTDAQQGTVLWSEQFERQLKDIFDVQDAITLRVAGTLAANLTRLEQQRALAKRPENLDAYDLVLRGRAALLRWSRSDNREARQLFERALRLDPNYAAPYAWLGLAYRNMAMLGWTEFPDDMLARAEESARKALSLDPENLAAHQVLSRVHTVRLQYDLALVETDRALALNPSDSESHAARGDVLLWVGRIDEAIAQLETAFALNSNLSAADAFALGLTYYLSRRLDDAVRFLEREVLRDPNYIYNSVLLAAAYGQLGRTADAQRMAEAVRRQLPTFDARTFGSRLQNRAHHNYVTEGLAKAGLN
jgi:adenylate cyclase